MQISKLFFAVLMAGAQSSSIPHHHSYNTGIALGLRASLGTTFQQWVPVG